MRHSEMLASGWIDPTGLADRSQATRKLLSAIKHKRAKQPSIAGC
jgi:hypothetical protein